MHFIFALFIFSCSSFATKPLEYHEHTKTIKYAYETLYGTNCAKTMYEVHKNSTLDELKSDLIKATEIKLGGCLDEKSQQVFFDSMKLIFGFWKYDTRQNSLEIWQTKH